jgi:hypothetical protein
VVPFCFGHPYILAGKAYFPNGQADTGFLSAIKHNIYIKVKLYKVLLVSVSSETHRGCNG